MTLLSLEQLYGRYELDLHRGTFAAYFPYEALNAFPGDDRYFPDSNDLDSWYPLIYRQIAAGNQAVLDRTVTYIKSIRSEFARNILRHNRYLIYAQELMHPIGKEYLK
jgi:hypothetical protein